MNLIEDSTSIKTIKKAELLFSEGQAASAFFIVISGSVKLYKLSADGGEQILHIQKPCDLVAEAIIFDFDAYPAFCEALEDSELIRLSKKDFLNLLEHFPEISFKIMCAYSRRLRLLISKIEELSLHDVKSRLASYLINNIKIENDKYFVPIHFTKKDLASVLGTIPETLSRTLSYFKKEKLVMEAKDGIFIQNKKKLELISKQG